MIDYLRGKLQRLQSDNSEAACALEDLCNLIRNESKSNRLLIDNEKRLYLMEKQIDDSNLALLHEREKTLDLQMECDRLQSQEMKDRKTINKLLELNSQCKCTINSISYFATTEFLESRILVEEVANKIVKTESSNIKSKDICSNGAATKNKDGVDGSKETVESLEMQLECLKTNLAESRSYNENAIKSLNLIIQNQATRLEERNEEKVGALEKLSAVSESYHNRLRDQQKKYVAQINKFSAIENQYLERLDRMRQQIKSNNNSKLSNIGRSNSRSKATETCVKMMKNSLVGSELQQSSTVLNLERTLDNSQSKQTMNNIVILNAL
ncbi:MAG: Coiled-coil domain-containing protein 77, variant 2 [Marteilia pararefringens]